MHVDGRDDGYHFSVAGGNAYGALRPGCVSDVHKALAVRPCAAARPALP